MPTQDSAALHPGLTAAPRLQRSAIECSITDAPEQTCAPMPAKASQTQQVIAPTFSAESAFEEESECRRYGNNRDFVLMLCHPAQDDNLEFAHDFSGEKRRAKGGYTISLPSPCNSRSSFGARAGVSWLAGASTGIALGEAQPAPADRRAIPATASATERRGRNCVRPQSPLHPWLRVSATLAPSSNRLTGKAAGHDHREVIQVGGDVQREAVRGDARARCARRWRRSWLPACCAARRSTPRSGP